MSEYVAFDSHKRYTWVEREDAATKRIVQRCRLTHAPGAMSTYLASCEPRTEVAVEATGNWYWIIDEIERAGLRPRLVHPRKAKLMMGMINKTDKLDAQRFESTPAEWHPAHRVDSPEPAA